MDFSFARPLVLIALLAGLPAAQAQPAFLVHDINTTNTTPLLDLWDWKNEIEAVGSKVFFVWDDGIHGRELWVIDGSPGGPHLVADICPGACSSGPASLTAFQGKLFFIADDGAHGREMWGSDGTLAGTAPVLEYHLGLGEIALSIANAGDSYLFAVLSIGAGPQAYRSDGTSFGVWALGGTNPSPAGSSPRLLAATTSQTLFAADDGVHGEELWIYTSPNSPAELVDINPGSAPSLPASHTPNSPAGADAIAAPWGGFLFTADDGTHGSELWTSDGTAAGTHLLKDIYSGPNGSGPHGFTAMGGAVYFAATGAEGEELWRTDGTAAGTTLVKDVNPSGSSAPREITAVGNRLFFLADDGGGLHLWRSDGTAAGTVQQLSQSDQPISFSPLESAVLSSVGGKLLFFAYPPSSSDLMIWSSDGTQAGTVPITVAGSGATYSFLLTTDPSAVAGGDLYFRAGLKGEEIWKSDGTAAGTVKVQSGPTQTSSFLLSGTRAYNPHGFAEFGGEIYFPGDDGTESLGGQLWKSDGTSAGTVKVDPLLRDPYDLLTINGRLVMITDSLQSTDGTPGGSQLLPTPSSPFQLTKLGNAIYFSSGDNSTGQELWKTDGTPAGTALVADLVPGSASSNPTSLTAVGSKLFFQATDDAGAELWMSDGTAAGSGRVADIQPGSGSSSPQDLTAAGNFLFFTAVTDGAGRELWKSDGTEAGTVMVKDIQSGAASSIPESGTGGTFAAPAGGPLFFVADDGIHGEELWKSDGTEAGTVLLQDISTGSTGSYPRWLTPVGNRVFFVADDVAHGRELWVSDGTPVGTHMVKDIAPGADSSLPYDLTAVGSVLVFSAFDPVHGVEPWRSDGTTVGTRRLSDVAPGILSSSPLEFTVAGTNVYFAANDNTAGFELWAVPQSNALATFGDVPTTHWAASYVEALVAAGFTQGCGDGTYCPDNTLTRAEMAVFLGRGLHGAGFVPPPATGTRFDDVAAGYWAAPWIEQIAADGVTNGCSASPPLFCPTSQVTRAEMAVFLLRARHGGSYVPPPATGTLFSDVPADYWAAPWIEQLAAEGVTNGCAAGRYCPDASVTRAETAAFLARTFNLPLP